MNDKKIIELDRNFVKFILKAFAFSICFVFIVNFFWGKITAQPTGPNFDSSIIYFDYYTVFDNSIRVYGLKGYTLGIVHFGGDYVKEHYFLKFYFALRSLLADYKFILLGTIILSTIKYVLLRVKFKFK